MDGPDYEPDSRVTAERVVASVIVAGCILGMLVAWGSLMAIRAAVFFMVPLTLIWIPDILSRTATLDSKWNRQLEAPPTQFSIRLIAWTVILGVPAAWLAFSLLRI